MAQPLATRIAEEVVKDLDLTWSDLWGEHGNAGATSEAVWTAVHAKVRRLSPFSQIKVIWFAPRDLNLYGVHGQQWLDRYGTGRQLIRKITETTIVAVMRTLPGLTREDRIDPDQVVVVGASVGG